MLIQWLGWPTSLATWEDQHLLCRRLPRAPAWGQAGSQEWGNVMGLPTTALITSAPTSSSPEAAKSARAGEANQESLEEQKTQEKVSTWPNQEKRQTILYTSPQWTR